MNNLDHNEFKNIINKIDSDIGEDSAQYKQTMMALAIVMTRGKEFRRAYRKLPVCERHEHLKSYLRKSCSGAQFDIIRFAMFREGFISLTYIRRFLFLLHLTLWSLTLYFIWFKLDLNIDGSVFEKAFLKGLISVLSLFFTAALTYAVEIFYFNSKLTSYFGLGHRNK